MPQDILMPVVLILAFVGYLACLSRLFWVTVALSAGLALYVSRSFPLEPANLVYWASALALFGTALLCLRLMPGKGVTAPVTAPARAKGKPQREVVIDGTNVMYWDGDADLTTLQAVVAYLMGKGVHPFVFLDASSRHHLNDKTLTKAHFAKALGLPKDRVTVCPAQTEADSFILKFAREQGLPVVSNDRFGDRAQQAKGLKLIKGVMANGRPVLQGL